MVMMIPIQLSSELGLFVCDANKICHLRFRLGFKHLTLIIISRSIRSIQHYSRMVDRRCYIRTHIIIMALRVEKFGTLSIKQLNSPLA
jgi:hypothetical protein